MTSSDESSDILTFMPLYVCFSWYFCLPYF